MAVAILIVTIKAQASGGAIVEVQLAPLKYRLANVPVSYARYLGKMIWFGNLAVLYPPHRWNPVQIGGACLLLLAITATCLWKLRSTPWLTVGWFWFLGVLVPMIGVIQFSNQAMADRFTYFSGIGLLLMVSWSIPISAGRNPVLVVAVAGTTLSLLVLFTIVQTRYWHDTVTLFRHSAAVAESQTAELNLGAALFARGERSLGITHLEKAVNLDPGKAKTQAELAVALATNHQPNEALEHARVAVRSEPNNANWRFDLAYVYYRSNRNEEAADQCRTSIDLNPQLAETHSLLGLLLCEAGKTQAGIDELKLAISIQPDLREAQFNLKKFENSDGKRHN